MAQRFFLREDLLNKQIIDKKAVITQEQAFKEQSTQKVNLSTKYQTTDLPIKVVHESQVALPSQGLDNTIDESFIKANPLDTMEQKYQSTFDNGKATISILENNQGELKKQIVELKAQVRQSPRVVLGTKKRQEELCHGCGQPGHIKADCPLLCSSCGERGHTVAECPASADDDMAIVGEAKTDNGAANCLRSSRSADWMVPTPSRKPRSVSRLFSRPSQHHQPSVLTRRRARH